LADDCAPADKSFDEFFTPDDWGGTRFDYDEGFCQHSKGLHHIQYKKLTMPWVNEDDEILEPLPE
jgi:hypothetical protein